MEVWLSFSSENHGRSAARQQKQGLFLQEGYSQGVCNIAVNWRCTVVCRVVEMPYLKQRQVFYRGLVLQRISLLKLLLLLVFVVGLDPSC